MLLAEPKQKLYAKTKVILDNLSRPAIENIDKQGRIYFTTYDTLDLNKFTLERFDPITGKVEELVKIQPCRIREGREIHYKAIAYVRLDMKNNIYYTLMLSTYYIGEDRPLYFSHAFSEIYKMSSLSKISKIIYRTEKNWIIGDMDVDKLGNIYFSITRIEPSPEGRVIFSYLYKLLMISVNGEVRTLVQFENVFGIGNIHVLRNPTNGVVFTVTDRSQTAYLYQYKDGKLKLLMKCRSATFFTALDPGFNGDLYYYYTSAFSDKGYMEIGRLNIRRETYPTILFSETSKDKRYHLFSRNRKVFKSSLTGDLFFVIYTIPYPFNWEGREERLIWLNIKTGTYTAILAGTPIGYSFVVDVRGNLYVARRSIGDIICIYRR